MEKNLEKKPSYMILLKWSKNMDPKYKIQLKIISVLAVIHGIIHFKICFWVAGLLNIFPKDYLITILQ